jgi:hypothetical protein
MYESPAYKIGSRVDICCVVYPMLLSHQSAVDKERDRESQLSPLDIDSWGDGEFVYLPWDPYWCKLQQAPSPFLFQIM